MSVRYGVCSCLVLDSQPLAVLFPVPVFLILLFDLINVPLSRSFVFISLCGAFIVLVFIFLSGLSFTDHMVASLAQLATEDGVIVCAFVFFSESLPGDDVLCRLLSHFLPHV